MVLAVAGGDLALGADSGRHPWIVVKGRHGDLSDKPGQIVADFPTEDQAAADAARRNTREPDLGVLYSIKLRKIPRPGVLNGTGEYSANIVEVYRRVKRGSDFLKNHTGELTRRAFNDINAAIRGFNQQYDQAATAGTLPSGVARVDEVSESAFRGTLLDDQKSGGEQAGGASGSGKYQVWVYELVGNQWVKRNERTWFTDDAAAAHNYNDQVDAKKPRWTATTNAPKESNSPATPVSADQASADLAAFPRDMEAYNRDRRAFNQEANAFERERKAVQSELDAVDREGLAFNELSDAERTDARLDALNRRKANAERRADQIINRASELKQRQAELDARKAELATRAETLGGVLETRP
jgi:hypothetical protein